MPHFAEAWTKTKTRTYWKRNGSSLQDFECFKKVLSSLLNDWFLIFIKLQTNLPIVLKCFISSAKMPPYNIYLTLNKLSDTADQSELKTFPCKGVWANSWPFTSALIRPQRRTPWCARRLALSVEMAVVWTAASCVMDRTTVRTTVTRRFAWLQQVMFFLLFNLIFY